MIISGSIQKFFILSVRLYLVINLVCLFCHTQSLSRFHMIQYVTQEQRRPLIAIQSRRDLFQTEPHQHHIFHKSGL